MAKAKAKKQRSSLAAPAVEVAAAIFWSWSDAAIKELRTGMEELLAMPKAKREKLANKAIEESD